MIQVLVVLLPTLWGAAAALALAEFLRPESAGSWLPAALARRLCALALLSHAGLFAARAYVAGGVPAFDGWWAISALAFALASLHLAVVARERPLGTDPLVLCTVFLVQLAASALAPLEPTLAPPRPVPFYLLHVTSILVASAALVLSGLHGLLYLILFRQLRMRRFGAIYERLPSLATLAQLMRRTALVAFVLLLIGTNGGIWWAHAADIAGFNYKDPGVVLSLSTCLYFGAVAFSRRIPGLTAKRTSMAAAVGLLLLVASLAFFLTESSFHWTR